MKQKLALHPYKPKDRIKTKYIDTATAVEASTYIEAAEATSTGYLGINDGIHNQQRHNLNDLVGENSIFGFKLQKWDGQLSYFFKKIQLLY